MTITENVTTDFKMKVNFFEESLTILFATLLEFSAKPW
jgi:hypothetical protein